MTVLMCFQINEFVKRARAAKIHSYIMGHLKKEMPAMMGKQKAQQRLIDNLEDEFAKVLLQWDMLISSGMLLLWRFLFAEWSSPCLRGCQPRY